MIHRQEEGFETVDSDFRYKIHHSQYGYSLGLGKKPIFVQDAENMSRIYPHFK